MSFQDTSGVKNFDIVTGPAVNTQVQTVIEPPFARCMYLYLLFQAVSGGNFASQSATCEVSLDNSTWYTVDSTINLGTSTLLGKTYGPANLGTTLPVNAGAFRYIRVTIPQIAALRTRILWTVK